MSGLEVVGAVLGLVSEQASVEHGRVGKQALAALGGHEGTGEHTPRLLLSVDDLCAFGLTEALTYKLGLVYHGREDDIRTTDAFPECATV